MKTACSSFGLRPLIALAAGVLLLHLHSASAQVSVSSSIELRPGVVIDLDRRVAYLMNPGGGIDAVGLARGEQMWSTKEAAKPLALVGDLLVGQTESSGPDNMLRIVVLDTKQGGRRAAINAVELPPGVRTTIDETLKGSFVATARALDGSAIVTWRYAKSRRGGSKPATDRWSGVVFQESADRDSPATGGAFRIDLPSGSMHSVQERVVDVQRPPDLPKSKRLAGVAEPQYVSADGRHVMGSKLVADDRVWDKYQWTIYDSSTGQVVGQARSFRPQAPFLVFNSQLVYETTPFKRRTERGLIEEPLKIRAVDLRTGEELWSRPIRDTAFRGPSPP